ncbi:MAG: ChbG/HpnK family deacetylase [Bryobacteraceae bacterium]|jgi:predicted glycoside hydrolase/deacetylase ChbG (UPF0249 family)
MPPTLLIVNADDFGFTPDVNQGIVDAHRDGILTSTTLMANGDAFDDAIRLARQTPALDIGCHLVLIGGYSLVTGKAYPRTVAQLLIALARRALDPYQEFAAQVRRIRAAGLDPSHLDTHKHTHLAPPVLDALVRVSGEFGMHWVRRPFDDPFSRLPGIAPPAAAAASRVFALLRGRFHRVLARHGCRSTDHFAGFAITGRYRTAELVTLLEALPQGSTELMCHPGHCGPALRAAPTRLKQSRQHELDALVSAEARTAIARLGIRLVRYTDL